MLLFRDMTTPVSPGSSSRAVYLEKRLQAELCRLLQDLVKGKHVQADVAPHPSRSLKAYQSKRQGSRLIVESMFLSLDSANFPPGTRSCSRQQLRLGSTCDSGTNTRKTVIVISERLSKRHGNLAMMVLSYLSRP